MKSYHVYAMGNALIDREIQVSPDLLEQWGVQKGVMTLIDHNRHQELEQHFQEGDHVQSCGGSAANTAMALSQLGARVFYSCKVGDDSGGLFYRDDLEQNGVDSSPKGCGKGPTGTCFVFITPDGDRTLNTFPGVNVDYGHEQFDREALKASQYLYIEGYLATAAKGQGVALEAKTMAKEWGVQTALSLSDPGVAAAFRKVFHRLVGPHLDLLFCNEEEALAFCEVETLAKAKDLLLPSVTTVVVTRGARGAVIWQKEKEYVVEAPHVPVLDTNGAGDLFAGSFLYGILQGHSLFEAGQFACHAASSLVSQFGPRPKKGQIEKIYRTLLGKQP